MPRQSPGIVTEDDSGSGGVELHGPHRPTVSRPSSIFGRRVTIHTHAFALRPRRDKEIVTMQNRRTFLGIAAASLLPIGIDAQTPAPRPPAELARHALTGPFEGWE